MTTRLRTRYYVLSALCAALTALLSVIAIPLPFSPVPVTMGLCGVYLTALVLPPRYAAMAQILYILIGAAGMPVFSGFRAGAAVLVSPTGGYLTSYPAIAWIISWLYRRLVTRTPNRIVAAPIAILAGLCVCYTAGTLWLCILTGITLVQGLTMAVVPFILPDVVKIIIVASAVPLIDRITGADKSYANI